MEVPIPTVEQAGQGFTYFATQAGLLNAVFAVFIIGMAAAIFFIVKMCRTDQDAAWARVTEISKERTADALATVKALGDTAAALGKVATLMEVIDRRSK